MMLPRCGDTYPVIRTGAASLLDAPAGEHHVCGLDAGHIWGINHECGECGVAWNDSGIQP